MYKYKNGVLYIQKEEVPNIEVNILNDLNASYRKYLDETIYEDLQYLVEEIAAKSLAKGLGIVAHVKNLVTVTHVKTQTHDSDKYYPVYGYFTQNGTKITDEWEILRIPYMSSSGKINVRGSSKVVLSVLRAAEDISYNLKQNMLNIAMPYANIRIYGSMKNIKMAYGNRRYHMHDIIRAMMFEAGDNTKLEDIFTNTYLINSMDLNPYASYELIHDSLESATISSNNGISLLDKFKGTQYNLGATRDALNEALDLRRAIGQTLSRDVLNYKAGTLVTSDMINDFVRNQINIIHVRNYLIPTGYKYAGEYPILIQQILAGTPNSEFLKERFPEYRSETHIPVDINLDINDAILIDNDTELTESLIRLLIDMGYTSLQVSAGKSKKVLKFSFEREIVGNYTAKLGLLLNGAVPPAGRSADEWVYYYNNPNFEVRDQSHMNCHDMIALTSIIGEILLTKQSFLLDRDTSFLKKVLMINEVFSETLRSTIHEFVKTYNYNIYNAIWKPSSSATTGSPFWSLTKKWISKMNQEKFLAPANTVDLAAEISQVCHINTIMPSNAEVVDAQRHLAMPFYGRICPYETPAGKKLGLVNTKAIGARVVNGLLYVPYRKVIGNSNGIKISNKITWLSVKDELGKKFGDILSLKKGPDGKYLNTPVLARIPNPDISDEPFIFKDIMSYELAGGYVTAVPEQFLSPTAALIPTACCDDPVRISYGLSQMNQTVYLLNSQKPKVRTKMYEEMTKVLDSERFISPCDGTITKMDDNVAEIKSLTGVIYKVPLLNPLNAGKLDTTIEFHYNVGDRVETGVCIAEAYKYPQPFVVRAPYDGRIHDITPDAIIIEKKSSGNSNFVNLENMDKITFSNGRISGQSAIFMNIHVSVGDYVHKGQILADTCASRDGIYSPSRNPLVAYGCFGYNYEDGVLAFERASINYTSVIAHKIEKTFSKKHYNYHRAYLPDGFKYCNKGDKVGYVSMRSGASEKKGVESSVYATTKATGIPFEITALKDTKSSKTFAYHLLGFNKLQAGDKMSGRHGNKGVVSRVLPDSMAPQLKNGLTIEFALNPCGVPSRMNLGQIDDCHLGLIAEVLGIYIDSEGFNGATPEDIAYLMRFAWQLANTPAIGDNVTKQYNRQAFDAVCSAFDQIPKEVCEDIWNNIDNVIDWRDVFDIDGSAVLYDPETDTYFDGKMTIGYPMYNKLMQEADEKINARAGLLEEQYARTSSQPQKSETSAKGQRMAEMELMALAAMGCHDLIDEIINEKSDNTGRRQNAHLKQLRINEQVDESSCYSRSVENLMYLLEGCGVKVEAPKDIIDVSANTSMNKYSLDINKLVHQKFYCGGKNGKSGTKDGIKKMDSLNDLSNFED